MQHLLIKHQDTTEVTQPNLIANCFARKSISRQRRICLDAEMWICAVRIMAKL